MMVYLVKQIKLASAFTQGSIDSGIATARRALKQYEDELAEYERVTGEAQQPLMQIED